MKPAQAGSTITLDLQAAASRPLEAVPRLKKMERLFGSAIHMSQEALGRNL